jgi:ribonuclease HI
MNCVKGKDTYSIEHTLRFDGGCAPTNPGPCAGSYVIYDNKGKIVAEGGEFFESGTNNYGEYNGLISGLKKCKELEIFNIHIEGDSLLVISQVCKKWKAKNISMIMLLEEVNELLKPFINVSIKHILREFNSYSDSLCDKILKYKRSL